MKIEYIYGLIEQVIRQEKSHAQANANSIDDLLKGVAKANGKNIYSGDFRYYMNEVEKQQEEYNRHEYAAQLLEIIKTTIEDMEEREGKEQEQ